MFYGKQEKREPSERLQVIRKLSGNQEKPVLCTSAVTEFTVDGKPIMKKHSAMCQTGTLDLLY